MDLKIRYLHNLHSTVIQDHKDAIQGLISYVMSASSLSVSQAKAVIKELIDEFPDSTVQHQYYGQRDEAGTTIMTVDEFREAVENRKLLDYDGYAVPMRNNLSQANCRIYPSDIQYLPIDATHIKWVPNGTT